MPARACLDDAAAAAAGLLYDAAIAPDLWPDALDALERVFASSAAHWFVWERAADHPSLSLPSRNYRGQDGFLGGYGRLDPRRQFMMRQRPEYVLLCHEHFSEEFVRSSVFYNEFSLPVGRRWLMAANVCDDADARSILAVFRPPGAAPYTDADRARLECLLPHLRRAFRLDRRLRATRAAAERMELMLDALPEAVFATDRAGRIRHANAAAEALLRAGDPLRRTQGRLTAALQPEAGALEAALHRAVDAPFGTDPGPAASLVLHARNGSRFGVSVMPLGRRAAASALRKEKAAASAPGEEKLALVSVRPLDPPPADPAPLRAAFGFTGAEAELAAALAGGRRLAEIAEGRGVAMPTVRTQLRVVFEKTGVSRQAELVRLIAGLPGIATKAEGIMP